MVPHLEILPPAQRALWPQLSAAGADFVLYRGTALSLQLGGRTSFDCDLFTADPLRLDRLANLFPFLKSARLQQQARDTATFVAGTGSDAVAISFFGGLNLGRVSEPVQFPDNGLYAAGLLDLEAQKIKAIQQRAEVKDYLDIHKLLSAGIALEVALGAAQALYPEFNAVISLKALSYFGDVQRLPNDIQRDLRVAASTIRDFQKVPKLSLSLAPDLGISGRLPSRDEPELEI